MEFSSSHLPSLYIFFFFICSPFSSTVFVFFLPLQQCRPSSLAPPHLHHNRSMPSSQTSIRRRLFHDIAQLSVTSFFQAKSTLFRRSHPHMLHSASFPNLFTSYSQLLCRCLMPTRHPRAGNCISLASTCFPYQIWKKNRENRGESVSLFPKKYFST